ncbi:IDEAL domain-containing protein [Pelagirhabdus alkalitolerans]|uniref:IDEAL domain-containing protein n=1 Tax=Pelagirhabdus alkalitolerans TaxID=1612202 RepID=A0A1G6H8D9_9BACI|nr:IDEAL domain-containing protein [Pelagirhabdus alkalitolerans]SDB90205.1 IDEAL domain-containing protein [Pelagirhabdus alkalitolerans]
MNSNSTMFNVGQWVELESRKGEKIQGFVEKMLNEQTIVQIRVVSSDNEWLLEQSIQVSSDKVNQSTIFKQYTKAELDQLIDLALLTNDKEWFDALTLKSNQLENQDQQLSQTST